MEIGLIEYGQIFFLSTLLSGLLTPIMRRIALRFRVVDSPNQVHKSHKEPIPYLGGMAIMISVVSLSVSGVVFFDINSSAIGLLLSILLPSTLIGIVGLVDDIRNLSPLSRFLAQTAAGLFTAIFITSTQTVGSPTGNLNFDFLLTVFWIVGITNALNFFDNHDGGASGTVAISSFTLTLLAYASSQLYLAALALVLCGSSLGFLFWNKNPARIYMGDAGSLFLGMMISSLLVRFDPNPINRWAGFAIPILLLALPIMDTTVVVISRIQRGVSPFKGGQDHLSHRLMFRGFTRRVTALILWGASSFFALLAIVVSNATFKLEGLLAGLGAFAWAALFIWFLKLKHPNQKLSSSQSLPK
jgi:UDP-GlcNAc:undecaprenyl-phosphate GlcNAc-1-phosphate transferase